MELVLLLGPQRNPISPGGRDLFPHLPMGPPRFSHCLFTFCLGPSPHLAQDKAVPMPPAPAAHYVLLTATLKATSTYLSL